VRNDAVPQTRGIQSDPFNSEFNDTVWSIASVTEAVAIFMLAGISLASNQPQQIESFALI